MGIQRVGGVGSDQVEHFACPRRGVRAAALQHDADARPDLGAGLRLLDPPIIAAETAGAALPAAPALPVPARPGAAPAPKEDLPRFAEPFGRALAHFYDGDDAARVRSVRTAAERRRGPGGPVLPRAAAQCGPEPAVPWCREAWARVTAMVCLCDLGYPGGNTDRSFG